jgi:hypothetical protein
VAAEVAVDESLRGQFLCDECGAHFASPSAPRWWAWVQGAGGVVLVVLGAVGVVSAPRRSTAGDWAVGVLLVYAGLIAVGVVFLLAASLGGGTRTERRGFDVLPPPRPADQPAGDPGPESR